MEKENKNWRSVEQEAETAVAIVKYLRAVMGQEILPKNEYMSCFQKSKKYIDYETGGLKNTAPQGKISPWERFKSFPHVLETCRAHKKFISKKVKESKAETREELNF